MIVKQLGIRVNWNVPLNVGGKLGYPKEESLSILHIASTQKA